MNYDFEKLETHDNPSVIFRGIVGSRAYGTANAQSDTDTRGIFIVPSAEYVRLVPPPKQVSDPHNDIDSARADFERIFRSYICT
jgi:predicted nucleotidyltransferase